jgi:hypothetical protein
MRKETADTILYLTAFHCLLDSVLIASKYLLSIVNENSPSRSLSSKDQCCLAIPRSSLRGMEDDDSAWQPHVEKNGSLMLKPLGSDPV